MLFLLLLVIASLTFYHFYTHYSRKGRMLNKLPGPPIIPIIGNIHFFMGSAVDIWNSIRKINNRYNRLNRIWIAHYPTINLCHPDDAEILLSSMKHIEKGEDYKFLHPWLKTGLLTSTGEKWQQRRKMLTPGFHFSILQQFLDIFDEQCQVLVQNLKSEGDETVQDLVQIFTKYTLNTICETAMGTSLQEADNEDTYRNAVKNLAEILYYRVFRPWLAWDWIFNLFSKGIIFNEYLSLIHKFSEKIIAERKEFHEHAENQDLKSVFSADMKINTQDDGIKSRKKRMAMLDHLIASQKVQRQIDDEGIREEVDTFIFAGHDTTAMTMSLILLMLARHKEIQDQARKEIDEVLNESEGKIGMAEVQRFYYLEQCIKETLRLYPTVPLISRKLNTDLQLKNYVIPAGCSVDLQIFDLHRNPAFWTNPEKYDPNRFLPENIKKRHSFCFIPFSAGPRNCIGQKFAMLELKIFMAQLLYNFSFEPLDYSQNLIFHSDLIIRPDFPMHVKFTTRIK